MAARPLPMTWLDAAVVAFLLLVGAGGYHQGLIRGLTRLVALAAIALTALVLGLSVDSDGDLRTLLLRMAALCLAVILVVGTVTWGLNRLVPRAWHRSLANRLLGTLPALLLGVAVAALLLGLAHRLAIDPGTQRELERGVLTGPLVQPVSWLERALVRGR